MKLQRPRSRNTLSALALAIMNLSMGTAMAAGSTLAGSDDLPLAVLAPRVRVVVDPDLETPALVNFNDVGGLPVAAADAEGRGRAPFFHPLVSHMYGTLNPTDHLHVVATWKDPGGDERVAFEQRERGVRVEGAYVTVTLSPARRVREIHSRFLYRPQVDWDVRAGSDEFAVFANESYRYRICKEAVVDCGQFEFGDKPARDSAPAELVIVSSRLLQGTALPPQTDRLAWRFDYALATLYVDASGKDGVLLVVDKRHDAIPRNIRDYKTRVVELATDATPVTATSPSPTALDTHAMIDTVDAFYGDFGRNGYDDAGGQAEVWIRWDQENAFFWLNTDPNLQAIARTTPGLMIPQSILGIGETLLGGDVVAHEITHGVTGTSAGLIYAGESGALNESYSDVMGSLIFPDTTAGAWLLGEETKHGAVRDMAQPSQPSDPNIPWRPDHTASLPSGCLANGDKCVHSWSGVPNLAAVLIAQGGQVPTSGVKVPGPGIGPEKLAVLYYETLVGTRMGPGSNFLSQRLATVSECESLVASGFTARGSKPFTAQDCVAVEAAFDAVGVTAKSQYGWTRFGTGLAGTRIDYPVFSGERLFNGCTIADQRLSLWSGKGGVRSADIAAGLGVDMGGWGGYVTARGAASDPTDRSATVHMWADWFVEDANFAFSDTFSMPPGLSREQCLLPLPAPGAPVPHLRTLYSAQRVSHWASFFNGGRYDETVNGGTRLPAGCAVVSVRGLPMARTVPVGTPVPAADFGSHGFRVAAGQPGDPGALDALVHSWHDGLSAVALRVAYDLAEDPGVDCLVPGALQSNP